MDYDSFKSVLARSKRKMAFPGIFLSLFGTVLVFAAAQEQETLFWVFSGGMLASGLVILMISVRNLVLVSRDRLHILKAIRENQENYIIWTYIDESNFQVNGVTTKTVHVICYTLTGKKIRITLKSGEKTLAGQIVAYLGGAFPRAFTGSDDVTRQRVGEMLNKKV